MKKLILAPAVALAFTGLVAAPVAAAETPSTQSDSAEAKAEQVKKEKAEQAKADEIAKDKAEQKKAHEEKAAADKAAEEKAAEDKVEQEKKDAADKKAADKKAAAKKAAGEKEATPKPAPKDEPKESPAPKDDDKDSKDVEEPKNVNASVSVATSTISAEDLTDKNKGITATVSGVEAGDKVTDSLTDETETADADGDYKLHVYHRGPAEDLEEGKVPFTVTIARKGEESVTLKDEIKVVNDAPDIDPEVSLSDDEISESDFDKDGITLDGTGFTPNGDVEIDAGAGNSFFQNETVTADDNGEIAVVITAPGSGLAPGRYTVTATDVDSSEEAAEQTFTITEDAVDPIDASLKVAPEKITAEDLTNKDKGVTVTVSGVKKGDKITDSLTGDTETANADGDYKLHLYYQGNPDSLEEAKVPFTVTIDREGTEPESLKGIINVVAEDNENGGDDGNNSDDGKDGDNGEDRDTPEAPAEASFTVSPKTMEAADFANEKKGVTLAVQNCEPGADVHFAVKPKGIQVTAYENTIKADDEGKASANVFGTSDNISAYVGSYTASATCGDDSMKESFTVTAGANGGGSDDGNGDGNDGSQLPRTGADLGGLASGAMLLLVGGAAIAMTGRRKKVGVSPSDF